MSDNKSEVIEDAITTLLTIAVHKLGGTLHIKGDEVDKIAGKCLVREDNNDGTFKYVLMDIKEAEDKARQSSLKERLDVN